MASKKRKEIVHKLQKAFGKELLSISKREKRYLILLNDIATGPAFKLKALGRVSKILKKNFEIIPLSELWDSLIEGKEEILNTLLTSEVVYDSSMIDILKICKIVTDEVKEKFEKHLITSMVVGSIVRGEAEPTSDIDMAFVIDDTDLKDMDRSEAQRKLFTIVNGIATSHTEREIQCQVYLLTDYWESLRDANPVIFTMLRDGIPIFDMGLFRPWKLLLRLGKIKPTAEAIENYLLSSEALMSRIKENLQEMAVEELYLAMLNPAQAALMLYGVSPMTHKETPKLMYKFFVKKERFISKKYVNWLGDIIKLRKMFEHGLRKEKISADELAKHMKRAEQYLPAIAELFEKIKNVKFKEDIDKLDFQCIEFMKRMLDELGIEYKKKEIYNRFKRKVFDKGVLPLRDWHAIKYLSHIKKGYEKGRISREEIIKAKEDVREFIRNARDYLAEKQIEKLPKAVKARFKHGKKEGELWIIKNTVFLVKDLKKPQNVYGGKLRKNGEIKLLKKVNFFEFTERTSKVKIPEEIYLRQRTLESLRKIFKQRIQILIS